MPHVVILGTCDTKLDELLYLRSQILENGGQNCKVTFVDVGRNKVNHGDITISQDVLTTQYAPEDAAKDVTNLPRGEVITHMIDCASNWMREAYHAGLSDPQKAIHGVVSAGGTGGTSLASGVMRNVLPIGFPKLIVSTNASGDTGPVVGEVDISMTYSVVDIAGTNSLLRRILSNAAGAIVGMAEAYERGISKTSQAGSIDQKKRVGLTMFGVTTPCVDTVRKYLESNYPIECFVFHCTGHGGLAMERLIQQGDLDAVLDITTTELCDFVCDGVMSAGPHRLEAALRAGIPNVISVGATDMVNFGPKATVPEKYQQRNLFEHNPTVTLMRTSPAECRSVGTFIVDKITQFAAVKKNVEIFLPQGGVSIIATPGSPFHDPAADEALFATIKGGLASSGVELHEDSRDINNPDFATDIAKTLVRMMGLAK